MGERTELSARIDQQTETLVKLYLLADKLRDTMTANKTIDELVRFSEEVGRNPSAAAITLTYTSTVHGNPLRRLLRDCYTSQRDGCVFPQLRGRLMCEGQLPPPSARRRAPTLRAKSGARQIAADRHATVNTAGKQSGCQREDTPGIESD